MKLMTKEILKKLPKLYDTEEIPCEEKVAIVKYFNPCGAATWYGIEYNENTQEFFGYIDLYGNKEGEYGYFSLKELENLKLPFGLKIERDLYFNPKKMSEILK